MDFFELLVRYETALWNHVDAHVRARTTHSLSTLWALRVVHRHPGTCRVHEVRHDLGITVGAASKLVDRLERDGLVARAPNPADGRSSVITLTTAGRSAHDDGLRAVADRLDPHLQREPGVSATTGLLRRLLSDLVAVQKVSS